MPQELQGGIPAVDGPGAVGRSVLDRDRIVETAVSFIDASGVSALTMRRLGSEMGVEAMSLYRYVVSREALVDAVVERVMSELDADPEVLRRPRDGWEDFLVRLARGIRRVALAHPRAFPLVASRPTVAPWLRPPLRTLVWMEALLAGLTSEGFDEPSAVAAYRAFSSFLLGHLLLEVGSVDAGGVGGAAPRPDGELAAYPTIERLAADLSQDESGREFEDALELMVERITRLRSV